MAKAQGPSFVDAHIEKIILAVCLLTLAYAVVRYGISTPRRLVVITSSWDEETVPPDEVDKNLLEAARRVDNIIKRVNRETPLPRTDLAKLEKLQQKPLAGKEYQLSYGSPVASGVVFKGTDSHGSQPTLEKIIAVMPAPSKPWQWMGEELIGREDENRQIKFSENPVWRAVTCYPWGELQKAWGKELTNTIIIPQLVAIGYEVEFQEKQPGGQWKTTDTIKPLRLDAAADETLLVPEIPEYNGTNAPEVRQAVSNYYSEWMIDQLQPQHEPIWTPQGQGDWQQHLPMKDILEVFPKEEKTESRAGRAPAAPRRLKPARRLQPIRNRRPAAMPPGMEMMPGAMPGMMPGAMPGRFGAVKKRPVRARRPAPAARAEDKTEEEVLTLPSPQRQIEIGKLLAWFHTGDIKHGREYRCRFRLIFVNPLLTHSQNVKKDRPQDATIKYIKTKWSLWSDTVAVYRELEFFVTGAYPRKKLVSLTVFAKTLGQRVRTTFSRISVGQKIGGKVRVTVISPVTHEMEETTLDFDTGAIPLEINFNKRIVTNTGGVRHDGVEMIYLDAKGKLCSRVRYFDKNSSCYRELLKEAKETESKVRELQDAERGIVRETPEDRRRARDARRKARAAGRRNDRGPEIMPGGMPGGGRDRSRRRR